MKNKVKRKRSIPKGLDREKKRNGHVIRILRVISILERHVDGISAREILRALAQYDIDCSIRTIYRDLDAIEFCRFPLENEQVDGQGIWKLSPVAVINSKVQISYNELVALYVSRELLEPLRGTPLFEDIDTFFNKIANLVGAKAKKELQNLSQIVGYKTNLSFTPGIKREVFECVHSACQEGQILSIEYRSNSDRNRGQVGQRRIGPLGILIADASIYLIGQDMADGQVKKFSLLRMNSVEMLEEAFNQTGLGQTDAFKDDFGLLGSGSVAEVMIQIKEPMATYVAERRFHHSQRVIRKEDDLIELRMNIRVNRGLVRWILNLGPDAKVLAPTELAAMVNEAARQIQQHYQLKEAKRSDVA